MKTKFVTAVLISILTLPILGCGHRHTYSLIKASASNCTYHGYSTDHYKCEGCGKYFDLDKNEIDIKSIELPLGDHVYGYRIERTYHVKCCEICGHVEGSESHEYNQSVAETRFLKEEATCVKHASYYISCICGKSSSGTTYEDYFVDENGKLGEHTYIHHDQVPPVNEEDGHEEYYSCAYCDLIFDANKNVVDSVPIIPANAKISIINKFNGAEIDILYSKAREFLETDNPAMFLYNSTPSKSDHTSPVKLSWNFNNPTGPFTLEIAKDKEFKNISRSYSFTNKNIKSLEIYNLVPDTYYYHIVSADYTCNADSFTIKGTLRTINTGDNILNMRDIGGYSTEDGKKVNYEYLYRSATWAINNPTNVLDIRLKELGIKTELDLRNDSNTTSQHPVEGINFVKYGIGQYTQVVPGGKNSYAGAYANISNIFNFLANENNYPIVYHCNAGADRTGTLTFLILGLLGVDYEDICRDFELTSIYYDKRWRSDIEYSDGNYTFTSSGIMQEDSYNYVAFDKLYKTMMEIHGDSSNKLSKAVENYLTSVCGVGIGTITTIKNILLTD